MKTKKMMVAVLMGAILAGGCAQQYKKAEKQMKAPINCATAQGDIRMLMHEKADVEDQIAQGVTAIFPAGLVVGVATGTEETKMQVATGDYNKMIDNRIKEIKEHCGIK
jgi:hypothetical protein